MKRALITGITGQDGSYLAELLLAKGYEVHGLVRRASGDNLRRIAHLPALHLHMGDLEDSASILSAMEAAAPDEIYNLAAMSHVRVSYDMPVFTGGVTGMGFARVLESARRVAPKARIYQAGSSEMFGKVQETPQTETTPFYPRSPYGCAKAYAFFLGRSYREGYGMNVRNGILFNHESCRRGEQFLSRKVAMGAARIAEALHEGDEAPPKLRLGNLEAKRDFGFAPEYVEAIWRIVQHETADDFLIATGETHSIREFVAAAFEDVGLDWEEWVEIDEGLKRPAEVDLLLGNSAKARRVLGWEPKVTFRELVTTMVLAETENQHAR
jgi:GDPmannose 4,6-dehydratase